LDGVVGISFFTDIDKVVQRVLEGERVILIGKPPGVFIEKGPRILTTPPGSAYLKITEGCNNRCSYCAIPSIRGNLRSRPRDEIVNEAQELVSRGVKELVVVGQDTAMYGADLFGTGDLPGLLKELVSVDGLEWIRLMYIHPAHINQPLIDVIAGEDKVLPYLDIPIQHASGKILKEMNRKHDENQLSSLMRKLHEQINGLVLRTTVMLGFPGETEEDFNYLYDFIQETEFDWLGAFTFVPEEGTVAFRMPGQIADELKLERRDAVMRLQKSITRKKNMGRLNKNEKILISSQISPNLFIGRGYFQAPEVDGITMVKSGSRLAKGNFINVYLKGIRNYDMIGEPADEYTE
jgi:ribosomal protein S12 methylthiotransferase